MTTEKGSLSIDQFEKIVYRGDLVIRCRVEPCIYPAELIETTIQVFGVASSSEVNINSKPLYRILYTHSLPEEITTPPRDIEVRCLGTSPERWRKDLRDVLDRWTWEIPMWLNPNPVVACCRQTDLSRQMPPAELFTHFLRLLWQMGQKSARGLHPQWVLENISTRLRVFIETLK